MSKAEAFDKIISESCWNPARYPDDGSKEYKIDLCCAQLIVIVDRDGNVESVEKRY